jgi:predicted nuclease of predicted toxin-antitoxin system
MRIYLDEDLTSAALTRLLQAAGHDVVTAASAGLASRSDAIQLAESIRDTRVCLTRNYEDFEELHLLVVQAGGRHHGIIVVRRENNPARDMTNRGIVTALRKVESSGVPVENEYIVLNQWR